MPDYKRLARQAATEVGVDPGVFLNLVKHESGFNPRARSPVGAEGLTQLMPGTAHGLATKYGIDPGTPYGNLLGGAYYLKEQIDRFGDLRSAVAAYNAGPGAVERYGGIPPYKETEAYVRNVLGGHNTQRLRPMAAPPSSSAPAAPRRTALQNALIQNLANIAARGGNVDPYSMLQGIVSGLAQDRAVPATGRASMSSRPESATPTFARGEIKIAPGADRSGVSLAKGVVNFASKIAGIYGKPLTIGTGTNHNRYVLGTHRQSAHWTGHAADIPASGADLTRLGRAALVAAGMSPAQAEKIGGGIFNIGGYQIIFNSMVGGNHYNHLHVGLRG